MIVRYSLQFVAGWGWGNVIKCHPERSEGSSYPDRNTVAAVRNRRARSLASFGMAGDRYYFRPRWQVLFGMTEHDQEERVRLDKWLWAARFYKTRALASEAIAGGKVQVNGDRAKRARPLQVGD